MKIDVIGDIHGCYAEFEKLTKKLGYDWESGMPVHPEGRKLSFVGDLTDRGPNSIEVIRIVYQLVKENHAHYSPGNHCNKLYRFFLGNKVQITHGLETTVEEYEQLATDEQADVKAKFIWLYESSHLYQILDNGKLIVAHAGIREDYIGKNTNAVKTFVLYGDITGKKNPDGTPVRRDWAQHYQGKPMIVYGHTPIKEPRWVNRTINIDTGAVFGNKLTAFRYPEEELISVPSSLPYDETRFREK
ncbi:bis(5'-nucleosyl)-tetraphosphatase PrpE [Metabacillus halosaccharovorans]|uniref:bis(5'-nucleosyl)-tetraphosphatase PrpE n=1 Tax=Metabacillus halosaccharovorans TaxID=930124 RepID=UPI001C1FA5E7|nr:bis(5'-nucleosyl)-tetraphosphatase PrpE [Metabacillus halosaccharovorans]MBU7591051.1 bis(5'-nucleosyl)-tetraphosphatase PrpE [Metabacillus halosaccharovorans]